MNKDNTLVMELNDQDLDEAIKHHTRLVVDLWAPWCPDCRIIAPVFADLSEDNKGKITFAQINMDNNQIVKDKYQVLAVPTLLIFKDGNLVKRLIEPVPKKPMLQAELDKSFA